MDPVQQAHERAAQQLTEARIARDVSGARVESRRRLFRVLDNTVEPMTPELRQRVLRAVLFDDRAEQGALRVAVQPRPGRREARAILADGAAPPEGYTVAGTLGALLDYGFDRAAALNSGRVRERAKMRGEVDSGERESGVEIVDYDRRTGEPIYGEVLRPQTEKEKADGLISALVDSGAVTRLNPELIGAAIRRIKEHAANGEDDQALDLEALVFRKVTGPDGKPTTFPQLMKWTPETPYPADAARVVTFRALRDDAREFAARARFLGEATAHVGPNTWDGELHGEIDNS